MREQNWLRLYGNKIQLSQFFDPSFGLEWQLHKPPLEAKGFIVTSSKPRQLEELRIWQLSFQWSGPESNEEIPGVGGAGPSISSLKLKKCFILQLSSIQQGKTHNTRQSMVSGFRMCWETHLKLESFLLQLGFQVDSNDSGLVFSAGEVNQKKDRLQVMPQTKHHKFHPRSDFSSGPDARRFHSFAKRVSSWTLVGR